MVRARGSPGVPGVANNACDRTLLSINLPICTHRKLVIDTSANFTYTNAKAVVGMGSALPHWGYLPEQPKQEGCPSRAFTQSKPKRNRTKTVKQKKIRGPAGMGNRKYSDEQVLAVFRDKGTATQLETAKKHGMSQNNVSAIWRRVVRTRLLNDL